MNKNAAVLCSCTVSLGAVLFVPWVIGHNVNGDEDAITYLSMAVISFTSAGIAMWLESKKEKPSIENIGLAALLNFIGLGIVTYELLTRESKPGV